MKCTMRVIIIMLCAVALVSQAAFADLNHSKCNVTCKHEKIWSGKSHDKWFFHKAHLIMKNASELSLSDDQKQKIKTLEYSLKKSFIKEDADIKLIALDIKQGIMKDNVDINAVNGLIDQKYALKAQKAKEAVQACVSLKKILTPDQSKKLKEIWDSSMMKHEGHRNGKEEK